MRARRLFSILGALALSIALVGCGPTVDVEKLSKDLVGTWELESGVLNGRDFGEEERDQIRELGVNVTLDLDSNGDMLYDIAGTQMKGTWKVKDGSTIELTVDSEPVDAPYENDRITMASGDSHMVFVKVDDPNCDRDPSENAGPLGTDEGQGDADAAELKPLIDSVASPEGDTINAGYVSSVKVTSPMDQVAFSNGNFDVRCVGVGEDPEGDTGYLLEVTNKSDRDVVLTLMAATVDGEDASDSGNFIMHAAPNATSKSFFFFDHQGLVVDGSSEFAAQLLAIDADAQPFDVLNITIN